jgi:peroxiredoxin
MHTNILKSLLFLALALATRQTATAQQFTIKGKLDGLQEGKIILSYRGNGKYVVDSAQLSKGVFTLRGSTPWPVLADLEFKPLLEEAGPMTYERYLQRDAQEFYLENGSITIRGDSVKTAVITAGRSQQEYRGLQEQLKDIKAREIAQEKRYSGYYKAKDSAGMKRLGEEMKPTWKAHEAIETAFIKKHPDSWVAFNLLEGKGSMIEDVQEMESLFNNMSTRLRNIKRGKELADRIALAKKLSVGNPAPDFTQNDTANNLVQLSSLKGKYVLLDFWASWCGPCRAENPNVKKAYDQYKDKNFVILAVSLDEKRDAWVKAIRDDNMPWIHVSDLKGWKNEVATQYGIRGIPQNLLLSPDGKIIARDLRGEALGQKLAETLQ